MIRTVTQPHTTGPGASAFPLPRREPGARLDNGGTETITDTVPPGFPEPRSGPFGLHAELATLRDRVPGVRGCVLAGTDGMLIGHNLATGPEPLDLAALAATTYGLGRQCGVTLRQGSFQELTVHSEHGYFTVYAVNDNVLLAVLSDDQLNASWLHLEAQPVAERLADLLRVGGTT